ncbi:MAG: hypothetical protein EXR11_10790 [Rhodospirillaceae bacterium]|nr:hypothetical protein [Rhodospirillaceae bacterium]
MRFTGRLLCWVVVAVGFGVAGAFSSHAQDSFQDYFWSSRVTTGFDYSAGKFGDTQTTEIAYVPVTLQTARGPYTLKLSGGWMAVAGPALILDGAGAGALGSGISRHVSGLADTSLSATYSIEQLYDRGVYIDLTARMKIPTASFQKGLGTGELDGVVQTDISFALGNVMPFATLGHKLNGSPKTLVLRDVTFGSLGLQYAWDDRVATGLAFDYRQSSLRTSSDPQEGTFYISYRFTEAWSFNLYGVKGFSRNSPNAGGGLTFTYRMRPGGKPVS